MALKRLSIDQHMPEDFKQKFPSTRVILDAMETPIQKPSHVDAQSVTWSQYKHKKHTEDNDWLYAQRDSVIHQ